MCLLNRSNRRTPDRTTSDLLERIQRLEREHAELRARSKASAIPEMTTEYDRRASSWLGTILLTLGCVVASVTKLVARLGLTPKELTDPSRLILQVEWAVALGLLVLAIVFFLEKLPLSSIGIRRLNFVDMFLALVLCGVGQQIDHSLYSVHAYFSVIYIRTRDASPILEWSSIVAASVAEELVYRGYFISRISTLTHRTMVAVIYSCTLFALWHFPLWGAYGVVSAGVWGILVTVFFLWRRDLLACMLMHFLTDAIRGGHFRILR